MIWFATLLIPKSRSFEAWVDRSDGHVCGYRQSNMGTLYVILFYESYVVLTCHARVQEPDWLGTLKSTGCSLDTRPHISNCPGQRRFSVLQHSELATYSRMVDTHVYHTESKLYSHGEQAVQRMRETRGSTLMPGRNRDRLVDCMEFVKSSIVMRPHFDLFFDRYSERTEKMVKRVNMEGKPGANPIM